MTTEVKTYNDLSYFSYHSSKNLLDWNVYELENGKGVHKRRVLLVCHKNKWGNLSQKFVTSLFMFIEGGQENITLALYWLIY